MSIESIVIADDDFDLVEILRARCEQLGLKVYTAYDAFNALNVIYDREPDLVCLDVNMPGGNGFSVLEMLVHNDALAGTPVIIMTGDRDQATIRRCYDLCAFYVEKSNHVWARLEPLMQELLRGPMPIGGAPLAAARQPIPQFAGSR